MSDAHLWLFGYGSLIWNPGFRYVRRHWATADGWTRRFWQGSHDHRGWPEAPGRVVTLVPMRDDRCHGAAFLVDTHDQPDLLAQLDHREKNGYERQWLPLQLEDGTQVEALTWIAAEGNFAWAGPAEPLELAQQIATSIGPSGRNDEYLFELAASLRASSIHDAHIFDLERRVRALGNQPSRANGHHAGA